MIDPRLTKENVLQYQIKKILLSLGRVKISCLDRLFQKDIYRKTTNQTYT